MRRCLNLWRAGGPCRDVIPLIEKRVESLTLVEREGANRSQVQTSIGEKMNQMMISHETR